MPLSEELDLLAKRNKLRELIEESSQQPATQGINHVAVFAKDLQATGLFFKEVLGMPIVDITANRDVPKSTHMNINIGSGMMLSFFDFPHVPRLQRRSPEGVGGIMHVAISISTQELSTIKLRLYQHKVSYQELEGSLYFKDPNGLGIELLPIQ